ncbi:MAG: chemotaxis response regulator protein-glutamate methylesterase [Gammaproteobacteria bacterium]
MSVRVLIIDDSALVRMLLTDILGCDPEIEVVGAAADPYIARKKIKQLNPDVLTLDVEMPRMDGITFLDNLMRLRPMPVVMVSALTESGAETTLKALELGAVDYIFKPRIDIANGLQEYAEEIVAKVKMAAAARVRTKDDIDRGNRELIQSHAAEQLLPTSKGKQQFPITDKIIAIGASTGGTEAIAEILEFLPQDMPGIVVTQHIPEIFSRSFAQHLDRRSQLSVAVAQDGQQINRGQVYIAPGNMHLKVVKDGKRYICRLDDGEPVNRHKPSVDVLFHSLAENVGADAVGVILTGMGRDGAACLGEMKQAGALTLAQDEKTSVVWGMPGESVKRGSVCEVHSLQMITRRLIELSRKFRSIEPSAQSC